VREHEAIMSDEGMTLSRPSGALALAAFVVAVVAMMVVPLPTPVLDVLLTLNLALSVALLLAAVYSARTLELSTFPTLLVLTTLLRLALNVSTVRLILLQADAGRVIHAFGTFVVRGDYVVGFAVFLILTIVQYVVISRGAERVAEVAARFTLDALPGQQLAIDAELRAGALDPAGARARRAALGREAQMYGALDGAMRFVKGDAIAGILILAISLVGGLIIGVVQRGQSLGGAAKVYTLLTIGDGLVSQLPALLISTAAGLVVTRVASDSAGGSLGPDIANQLLRPRALGATAILLGALALVPGLPLLPFALVGGGIGALAFYANRRRKRDEAHAAPQSLPRRAPRLELAIAPTLQQADLETRVSPIIAALADELGVVVPQATISVDAQLAPGAWQVRLRGLPMARGVVPQGQLLADANPSSLPEGIEAEPAAHPATGALASWVPAAVADRLKAAGITLLDAGDCLTAALESALRGNAAELVGLDETQRLADAAAQRYPALVREVVGRKIDIAGLASVLRGLVAEGVPLGDLRDVLEALARNGEKDPVVLVERVRAALARTLSHRYAPAGRLEALTLDGEAEDAVRGALRPGAQGVELALEPDFAESLIAGVRAELEQHPSAVLLAPADLRRHLSRLLHGDLPRLPVLAYHELLPEIAVERAAAVQLR
jgi:type III secretion protein V